MARLPPMPSRLLPFSYEGLPHLSPSVVVRGRLLARAVAARAGRGRLSVRGLGRVTVRVESVDLAPWDAGDPEAAERCRLVLVRGDSIGRLELDAFFALGLVRAVLGAPAPAVMRALGPAERGVLAAVIASALSSQGEGVTVGLQPPPSFEFERVAINLTVKALDLSGTVRLDVPLGWLAAPAAALDDATARLLQADLRLELGKTSVDRRSWATAEVGDTVLFAGVSPLLVAGVWPCLLRVGGHGAAGEILADGTIRCLGSFTPTTTEVRMKETTKSDDPTLATPEAESAAVEVLLAEAPVEVVAELGRLTIRGDELVGLCRGSVLALGPRRAEVVTLRVAGREWAKGELVTIDDQLGVRITELRRRP
jgi:type III secretion system YscQ/HrcQ family protein